MKTLHIIIVPEKRGADDFIVIYYTGNNVEEQELVALRVCKATFQKEALFVSIPFSRVKELPTTHDSHETCRKIAVAGTPVMLCVEVGKVVRHTMEHEDWALSVSKAVG